jgi:hypothetical protein
VSLADQFALLGTAWPYVYAVAGLLVLAAAGVMALTAPRWPSRASRFERPGTGGPGAAAATVADGARDEDPAALWRLLDAGLDPTVSPDRQVAETGGEASEDPEPSSSSGRADVREQPSGVTMKPRVAARTDEPT